ncbi:hypothetical protein HZ326_12538 [Fusarium oxysporum f. sp. albedinis]|nr:hypothetical protein HZ326_12538 [Fusarium oxysporum f. sp. albedinis]
MMSSTPRAQTTISNISPRLLNQERELFIQPSLSQLTITWKLILWLPFTWIELRSWNGWMKACQRVQSLSEECLAHH